MAEKWTVANHLCALIEVRPLFFLLIKGGGAKRDSPAPVKYETVVRLPMSSC